jgi:uncharacterized protein YbaR (Trm112 family)
MRTMFAGLSSADLDLMVCPVSKQKLWLTDLATAESMMGSKLKPRVNREVPPVGVTPTVLLRKDREVAYPILDDIPVLMGPEGLTRADNPREVDLQEQKYAEAYEEMAHYNHEASQEVMDIEQTQNYQNILKILRFLEQNPADFPSPRKSGWMPPTPA